MNTSHGRRKLVSYTFIIIVVASSFLLRSNLADYIGLLTSMNSLEFSLEEMSHKSNLDTMNVTLRFRILNPTVYSRLKLSSIQCQIYLISDNNEVFVGATAYAPSKEMSLESDIENIVITNLIFSKGSSEILLQDPPVLELNWRVRCTLNLSNPLRKYYQNYNIEITSTSIE